MRCIHAILAVVVLTSFASASESFLKIDGIVGNTTNQFHPGEIDVDSYSVTGGTSGGASSGSLSLNLRAGKATPSLLIAAYTGQTLSAVLTNTTTVVSTTTKHCIVWRYTFTGLRFTPFSTGAVSTAAASGTKTAGPAQTSDPVDTLCCTFDSVKIEYAPVGSTTFVSSAGWNLKTVSSF